MTSLHCPALEQDGIWHTDGDGRPLTKINLSLNPREIELLRNSTSDLGINDKDCVSLQLKIANALLDAK